MPTLQFKEDIPHNPHLVSRELKDQLNPNEIYTPTYHTKFPRILIQLATFSNVFPVNSSFPIRIRYS